LPDFRDKGYISIPLIDPPTDTEAAKTAPVVSTYRFPGPNLTLAETWTTGHRTPYGLAFGSDGRLWEVEHGPRGGDDKGSVLPQWNGNALISGLVTQALVRITFDGQGGATAAQRWSIGKRVRDIEEAPDGSLWMLEDADPGGLFHLTPK
jgi:glucose/arabinose dehydrogenase